MPLLVIDAYIGAMMVQLLLSCSALSSPTLCRFIPALSERPSLTEYQIKQYIAEQSDTPDYFQVCNEPEHEDSNLESDSSE